MAERRSLFEVLSELHYKDKKRDWVETTGVYTGKFNKDAVAKKTGYVLETYSEYEVKYNVEGKPHYGWYSFYPLPDPDPIDLSGQIVQVRYNKRKPYIFEITDGGDIC